MKKLLKISVLFAVVLTFTACSGDFGKPEKTENSHESIASEYTHNSLLTEAEISELTLDALLSDISDGTWLYQSNTEPEPTPDYMEEKQYNKFINSLTETEKNQVESWIDHASYNQREGCITLNIPFETVNYMTTLKVVITDGEKKVKAGTIFNKYTITDENAVIKKYNSYTTWQLKWDGNTGSWSNELDETEEYRDYEYDFKTESFLPTSWKTNAEKNKFYGIGNYGHTKFIFVMQ